MAYSNAIVFQSAMGIALGALACITPVKAQDTLPFPPKASGSIAARTMQESVYSPAPPVRRLPDNAPNVLIILVDDAGPGLPSAYGGEVHTPTLEKVGNSGIVFNRFHTTGMCSPSRASLLTGRNHHRVGAGQIAEFANDWDGYSGTQPKSSAMLPEVLKNYGYATGAWGKWHNTPAEQTTAAGPFDYWPTGYGFEYFYGFLAGEASQYEPSMVRNTTPVEKNPAKDGKSYHLSEDLADDAINWLHRHKSFQPEKPFMMYWASGAIHGPQQIAKEWADKYKGKFDDGWDEYRKRVFERQKARGWIPADAKLTERDATMPSWESIPENEKPFQRRLMEIAAGFAEHVDVQAGRLVDEIDKLGYGDNTIIVYIWGDNGSSAEGQNGTISELLAQNGIPSTVAQHIAALDELGGMEVLGSPKTDNQYHAGWAWAGSTPYKGTKLLASHLGGTRNPMAVRWPARIQPDKKPRSQFLHVIDVVPTIYEVVGIEPPQTVSGISQDPFDGVSFAAVLEDPKTTEVRHSQYFEIMGSRSFYQDGWMASALGPRIPWIPGTPKGIREWTPDKDKWELYNLNEDWTQAVDLADKYPEKLAQMKESFAMELAMNKGLPVGGGLWVPTMHPELRVSTAYKEWTFPGGATTMPEFCAPKLGSASTLITMDTEISDDTAGVLFALGGFGGGLTCYIKDGKLCYEYNLFEIQRTKIETSESLPKGKVKFEVETSAVEPKPSTPLKVTLKGNGKVLAEGTVPVSAPLLFTANDNFSIGSDTGSPVAMDYIDIGAYPFTGKIHETHVKYTEQ